MKAQILFLLLLVVSGACAQEERPWAQYLNEVMTAEDVESSSWEQTYDLLCELEQSPLDVRTLTREQLEELPFLSALQIEEIMEYLYRYGPMRSLGELQMIRSLDYTRRQLLTYFLQINDEEPSQGLRWHDVMRYGHHELMASGRIPATATWAVHTDTGCAISSAMATK